MYVHIKWTALYESRDSAVGIAAGYWLDGQRVGVRLPAEARDFSLLHSAQTDPGTLPTSYTMGSGGCFREGKAAGT
jgi:hypothetical protein